MTPNDETELAAAARAGDRTAAEALLRLHEREVRSIVYATLARVPYSFSVYEDAVAEAMFALWRTIQTWDPARSPLVAYARMNIERAVRRTAASLGHAVHVPVARPKKLVKVIEARAVARSKTASFEEPGPGELPPLRERMAGASTSPEVLIDVQRALARVRPEEAAGLMDVAAGERISDAFRREGASRQAAHAAHARAMARASKPFRRAA